MADDSQYLDAVVLETESGNRSIAPCDRCDCTESIVALLIFLTEPVGEMNAVCAGCADILASKTGTLFRTLDVRLEIVVSMKLFSMAALSVSLGEGTYLR